MPRINLLPWRMELRQRQKQEFMIMLGMAAAVSVLIGMLVFLGFVQVINQQKVRNGYLEAEIAKLDKKIAEIRELTKKRDEFLARIRAIEALQTQRPLNVRLFDELVKAVPEGLSLTSLSLSSNNLVLDGVAQSNARVSALMRNLEASDWLESPRLNVIQARASQRGSDQPSGVARLQNFKVAAKQTLPKARDDDL